jgi:hypothetical protein
MHYNAQYGFRGHPATKPLRWTLANTAGTTFSTAIASSIADAADPPSSNMATGRFVITTEKPILQLVALVSDADNETATFGIYGFREIADGPRSLTPYWTFSTLMTGSVTAGAKQYSGSGNTRYADTWTISTVSLPVTAYRTIGIADDVSVLEFDTRDWDGIMVVGSLNSGTGASVNFAYSGATL